MNLLSKFIGRKVLVNPSKDEMAVTAKIEEADNHGVLLEVIKSPKPYATGFEEGSLHYISNSTPNNMRLLEDE